MKSSLSLATMRYSGALSMLANPSISPTQVQRGVSILAGAAKRNSATDMTVLAHVLSTRPDAQMQAVRANLRSHFTRVALAATDLLRAGAADSAPRIHPTVAGFFASLTRS